MGSGTPFTEVITTELTEFDTTEVSAELFEIPDGYVQQKPIMAGPGQ